MQIDKIFLICSGSGCGNVLGCFKEGEPHRFCETTKPGSLERSFGCNKEQFFTCTFEKDMIECGDAEGRIVPLVNTHCRHCPSDQVLALTEEELGQVAYLSSPAGTDELTNLILSLDEICCK